ncbi:MAG: hypothetical protein JW881_04945 [Spirochaetales bacterium]|nr:hypothetical protein [Spirochaetales bacterium]
MSQRKTVAPGNGVVIRWMGGKKIHSRGIEVFSRLNVAILVVLVCILASCVGIQSDITFKKDGSGTISLTYHFSKSFGEFGKIGEEEKPLPFPVHKEDFLEVTDNVDGLLLQSYERSESGNMIVIKAVVSFASSRLLTRLERNGEASMTVDVKGDATLFRQELPVPAETDISADTLSMIETYFADYSFVYIVNTPKPINSYNVGGVSKNRQTFTYETTMAELLTNKERAVIELQW